MSALRHMAYVKVKQSRSDMISASGGHFMHFAHKYLPKTHYFLDKGVYEFCKSSIRDLCPSNCAEFSNVQGPSRFTGISKDIPNCYPNVTTTPEGERRYDTSRHPEVFAVHFPEHERRSSLLFCSPFAFTTFEEGATFTAPTGRINHCYYINARDNETTASLQQASQMTGDSALDDLSKFLFGFSLYLKAFPDLVKDVESGEIKQMDRFKGKRLKITKNATVAEDVQNSKSPHWRRGHFRLLSADRYKENKGNVIFVKGTFVKGRALQVENVERVMSHA